MTWNQQCVFDWTDVTGGVMAPGRIVRALRPLVAHVGLKHGVSMPDAWEKLRPWWREYLALEDPRWRGPERFAANPGIVMVLRRKKGDLGGLVRRLRG